MSSLLIDATIPVTQSNAATGSAPFHSISAIELDGVHTDIVLHRFADKICLFITQFERISNVFVAHANTLHGGVVKTFREIEHRFGTDTDEIQSAIRHLVSAVPELNDAPVDIVVTLGLKCIDRKALLQLEAALRELM